MITQCKCGCGTDIPSLDARGRPRHFAHGHGGKGKKHSPEWLANKSKGLKRAWSDPNKFKTMRVHSPDLIHRRTKHMKGRILPADVRKKISESHVGRVLSEEHRLKSIKNLVRYNQLSDDVKATRNLKISIRRRGQHNFGRAQRDRLDHFNAKHWVILSPIGNRYEFDNLQSWARKHEHLMLPDMAPLSRLPLWKRFAMGFNNMRRTDAKACHHWRGWTLVQEPTQSEYGLSPSQLHNRTLARILTVQSVCGLLTRKLPTS